MSWHPLHLAWQDALYGERGFYRTGGGAAEHFATSVRGIAATSAVVAQAVSNLATEHGLGRVIDVGCGLGDLLRELADQRPDLELVGVEVTDRPVDLPERIGWWRSAGGPVIAEELTGLRDVLVLAHEWLDNVPCVVAELDDQGLAREVQVDDDGRLRLGGPLAPEDEAWRAVHWPESQLGTFDIGRARDTAWADLLSRVEDGVVVAVDYGHVAAGRPAGSTLMGYRDGAACPPLFDGSTDVTAHVAMDTLPGAALRTQREVLAPLAPATPPQELARTAPADYLRRLAARSEWAALVRSDGLGDFRWATAVRGGRHTPPKSAR